MSKKSKNTEFDASRYTTLEELNEALARHKNSLHSKVKLKRQLEEDKKAETASYNEQIKEIGEEINGELEILDELADRGRELGTDEYLTAKEQENS